MNMMAKVGFKPGQTLGQQRETTSSTESGGVLSKEGDQIIAGLKAPITLNIGKVRRFMSQGLIVLQDSIKEEMAWGP